MKKLALSLMLSISCVSAMDVDGLIPNLSSDSVVQSTLPVTQLDATTAQAPVRSIAEIKAAYAIFQKSIIDTELPADPFNAMNAVYPVVAAYYADQAAALSADLATLTAKTDTLTTETDIELNKYSIAETVQLITKYTNREKHLNQNIYITKRLFQFITAAYDIDSGLSSYDTLIGASTSTYTSSDTEALEVTKYFYASNFKQAVDKLKAEIKTAFADLLSINIEHFLNHFNPHGYDSIFHSRGQSSDLKQLILNSGDFNTLFNASDRGIPAELAAQIDKQAYIKDFKDRVIKEGRTNEFNKKMRDLNLTAANLFAAHIELATATRYAAFAIRAEEERAARDQTGITEMAALLLEQADDTFNVSCDPAGNSISVLGDTSLTTDFSVDALMEAGAYPDGAINYSILNASGVMSSNVAVTWTTQAADNLPAVPSESAEPLHLNSEEV
ncbi:MAG: hypothetical protein V4482_00720 [Pseudomonadota bacterium]